MEVDATAGVMLGAEGVAPDTTGGLIDGGETIAEETTMAGTVEEIFFSSGTSGCWFSLPVSTVTVVTAWGCTLAGVCARLGRVLVPEPEVGGATNGDRGQLLGVAGDGGLFLGFWVLVSGLDLWMVAVGDVVSLFLCTLSFASAFFSFSFSLSLSFFSFFFLSTGVVLIRRCRCVMSGVLADESLQRSAVL